MLSTYRCDDESSAGRRVVQPVKYSVQFSQILQTQRICWLLGHKQHGNTCHDTRMGGYDQKRLKKSRHFSGCRLVAGGSLHRRLVFVLFFASLGFCQASSRDTASSPDRP